MYAFYYCGRLEDEYRGRDVGDKEDTCIIHWKPTLKSDAGRQRMSNTRLSLASESGQRYTPAYIFFLFVVIANPVATELQ